MCTCVSVCGYTGVKEMEREHRKNRKEKVRMRLEGSVTKRDMETHREPTCDTDEEHFLCFFSDLRR